MALIHERKNVTYGFKSVDEADRFGRDNISDDYGVDHDEKYGWYAYEKENRIMVLESEGISFVFETPLTEMELLMELNYFRREVLDDVHAFIKAMQESNMLHEPEEVIRLSFQDNVTHMEETIQTFLNDYPELPEEKTERILSTLKENVQEDDDLIYAGFTCLGNMTDVYADCLFLRDYFSDWYRTWIWENEEENIRVATGDNGNGYCSVMCEGTAETLAAYFFMQEGEEAEGLLISYPITDAHLNE